MECRRFIKFALPEGIQASKNQEKELDPLYDEFDMKETENTGCRIESTILALEALYELSKNCVGRSLLLCGMYPFRDDLPAPFDL